MSEPQHTARLSRRTLATGAAWAVPAVAVAAAAPAFAASCAASVSGSTITVVGDRPVTVLISLTLTQNKQVVTLVRGGQNVATAVGTPGSRTLQFQVTLSPGTYTLTSGFAFSGVTVECLAAARAGAPGSAQAPAPASQPTGSSGPAAAKGPATAAAPATAAPVTEASAAPTQG